MESRASFQSKTQAKNFLLNLVPDAAVVREDDLGRLVDARGGLQFVLLALKQDLVHHLNDLKTPVTFCPATLDIFFSPTLAYKRA